MKPTSWLLLSVALAAIAAAGCKTKSADVTAERQFASQTPAKPAVVYVADFELGAYDIKSDPGILSGRPGPVGSIGERLSGSSSDPARRARDIVQQMSNSLLNELSKAGFTAQRLVPGAPPPTQGWLVRGVFTEVDEGNRLRRAMIGFGQGQTDIQVVTDIHNLTQGAPEPLYQIATDASSGAKPGAAPTLVLGPYGAAARFVMSGKDLDKGIKQTAAKIAEELARQVQQGH